MSRDESGRDRRHPLHDAAVLGIALALLLDSPERKRAGEVLRRANDELEVRVRQRIAELARANDALQGEAAEEFDLVLSDIELPDGSGLELMHELRKTRDTPGIAMSGFGSEEDARSSRSAGFAEHLTKPINDRTLEEAIRRVGARREGAAAAR